MEKQEIETGNPITTAGVTLIPVIKVSQHYWCHSRGISCFGVKQPLCVIVVSRSGRKALRISGEEVPLEELMPEVPAIRELLNRM